MKKLIAAGLIELENVLQNNRGRYLRVVDSKTHLKLGKDINGFPNSGDRIDPSKPVIHRVTDYHFPR